MKNPAPEGYTSVSPYLMVDSLEKEMEFLQAVFDAEVKEQLRNAEGQLWHCEARIGNTIVMLGQAQKDRPAGQSMLYVWVDNVNGAHRRALKQGAASIQEPMDQFYGNREAGIKDPEGNIWWIAQEVERLSSKEIEQRLAAQRKKRL
jgi:uncharacterized glyoxalase superfamily protein PhnB